MDPKTIFLLSHPEDQDHVNRLEQQLLQDGYPVWKSDEQVLPGQNQTQSMYRAINAASVVLVFLSQHTHAAGPFHRDLKQVMARFQEIPDGHIFPIPVLLSEVDLPYALRDIQPLRLFAADGYQKLVGSLEYVGVKQSSTAQTTSQKRYKTEQIPDSNKSLLPNHANPFDQVHAIKDPQRFVGRAMELADLEELMAVGSVSMQGSAKIGKSSLVLKYLNRADFDTILGPYDFQGLDDADEFFHRLAEDLGLPSPDKRAIREKLRTMKALVVLEEMEAAPKKGFDHTLFAVFRAVCNRNNRFRVLTVSRKSLKELYPDEGHDSPVFNIFQPFTLNGMRSVDGLNLLAHPWAPDAPSFDVATCRQLLELAGDHPFRLQRAGFHRFKAMSRPDHDWRTAWQFDMDHML